MAKPRASGRNGPATLNDVAREAGVDRSTASRVLNDRPIRVRKEKRELIHRLADELGYFPSAAARGLKKGRTGALGLLIPDFANPVYATVVRAAAERAEELGYAMLMGEIRQAAGDPAGPSFRRLVHERRIDGLIVASARDSDAMVGDLERANTPHVFAHRKVAGARCSVTLDDERAAGLAAEHFASLGHRRLGVVLGPVEIDTARRRLKGFRAACRRLGLRPPVVESDEFTARGGYDATVRLLARKTRPTALFASNLLGAVGSLAALNEAGVAVPEDMSVIAFDDAEIADFTIPPVTTISVPYADLGRAAVDAMDAVIRGESPGNIVVPTPARVIERRSVAQPPG